VDDFAALSRSFATAREGAGPGTKSPRAKTRASATRAPRSPRTPPLLKVAKKLLSRLRPLWKQLATDDRPRWIAALSEAYRPPSVPIRDALQRDRAWISFVLDQLEDPEASDLVAAEASTWLHERLDEDLDRLASALDVAFLVKPQRLLERITTAAASSGRWELAHAALVALGKRLPEQVVDLDERAARALVSAGARDRARRFAQGCVRDLRRAGREGEASRLAERVDDLLSAPVSPAAALGRGEKQLFPAPSGAGTDAPATSDGAPKETIDVHEAAQILGVSQKMIYAMAKKGAIASFKVGRAVRFSRQVLMSWRREQMKGGGLPPVPPPTHRRRGAR